MDYIITVPDNLVDACTAALRAHYEVSEETAPDALVTLHTQKTLRPIVEGYIREQARLASIQAKQDAEQAAFDAEQQRKAATEAAVETARQRIEAITGRKEER